MAHSLREIMTRNVTTVSSQHLITDVAKLMSRNDIGSVPVVDNDQYVGIISDRDIVIRAIAQDNDINTTKVETAMTRDVVTGTPDMDVHRAADMMADMQIRRLPVVDNGKLVGIVSLGDLATVDIYQNEAGQALSEISEPTQRLYL
ncbi:MAG: CBS domain-containing protein [Heliobacteriaceae bacterium]|nr:CBS domain-containing protein [Heliobacteriaceae bacterium]